MPLLIAGGLAVVGARSHAYLGERLVLIPLFRDGGVPATPFGGVAFTQAMLRAVWHFFTVVVLSVAVLFFVLSNGESGGANETAARIIGTYFAIFAPLVLVLSRGRHFAWLLASGIADGAWWGTL